MDYEEKGIRVEEVVTAETRKEDRQFPEWIFPVLKLLFLILASIGFAGSIVRTFDVPSVTPVLVAACILLSCLYAGIYSLAKRQKILFLSVVGAAVIYTILFHSRIVEGIACIGNLFIGQINSYYGTHVPLAAVEPLSAGKQMFSLILILVIFIWVLAYGIYKALDARVTALVLALSMALALAVGRFPDLASTIFMTISLIGTFFLQYTTFHDALIGNVIWVQMGTRSLGRLRTQTAVTAIVFTLLVGILSLGIVGPAINRGYENHSDLTESIQNGEFVDDLRDFWKKLTRGEWDWLPFDIVRSSGVHGGKLSNVKEVRSYDELHLYLDISSDVEAPFYIRGYVGTNYTGQGWRPQTDAQKADAEATGFSASDLYVQYFNLLTSLQEQHLASVYGKLRYVITNVAANDRYSYLPYGTNLTGFSSSDAFDTYTAEITDENIFELQYLNTQRLSNLDVLENAGKDNTGDSAYREYVRRTYLDLPENGLEQFYAEYAGRSFSSIADTVKFVRETLEEHATYTMKPGAVRGGEDFVEYFLYTSKEGYCTHFASAAVLLFRLYGIPARYVEGYLTDTLTADGGANEIYDSSAHAWAEIYIDGAGWVPIETTPGFISEKDMEDDRSQTIDNSNLPDVEPTTSDPLEDDLTEAESSAPEETPTDEAGFTPPPTLPTQSEEPTTPPPSQQQTQPSQQQSSTPPQNNDEQDNSTLQEILRFLLILIAILLLIAAVILLILFIIRNRYRRTMAALKKRFAENPRSAIFAAFGKVEEISTELDLCLDEFTDAESAVAAFPEIASDLSWYQALCLEAGFSNHPFDQETADRAIRFYRTFAKARLESLPKRKRLICQYIHCWI